MSFTFRMGWLLWFALASVACLPPAGWSPFTALAIGGVFVTVWIVVNIHPKQVVCTVIIGVLEVFFRELVARNRYKVPPQNVPCIFVCAPHANQFLDPFVVMNAVGRLDLCFLVAAKTARLKLIGKIASLLEGIPVERAADLAFRGAGVVWISPEDQTTVLGQGTRFLTQIHPNDSIIIGLHGAPLVVQSIASDEKLVVTHASRARAQADEEDEQGHGASAESNGEWKCYTVQPFVDRTSMFDAVTDALHAGKAIGIFPEGGSHDRPSLLPLKSGVAIMALGALSKHPTMPLRLCPVGLNYFSGHRFRSRVFVDIGEPLTVPTTLLTQYLAGGEQRRCATDELMRMVNSSLSALTISAPDYETLEFFWTLRRLVKTSSAPLSLDQQTELARRFASGYERKLPDGRLWKDTERVSAVRQATAEYNARLKSLGLRDYQVANVMSRASYQEQAARLFAWRVFMLLGAGILWLPMTLLSLPLILLTRIIAACKTQQALRNSRVKIYGRDVAATWKVLVAMVLVPAMWLGYTWACGAVVQSRFHLSEPGPREASLLAFFLLPPLSYTYILLSEQMIQVARSLPPLLLIAMRPSEAQALTEQREKLRQSMLRLVDADLGWKDVSKIDLTPRNHWNCGCDGQADASQVASLQPPNIGLQPSDSSGMNCSQAQQLRGGCCSSQPSMPLGKPLGEPTLRQPEPFQVEIPFSPPQSARSMDSGSVVAARCTDGIAPGTPRRSEHEQRKASCDPSPASLM